MATLGSCSSSCGFISAVSMSPSPPARSATPAPAAHCPPFLCRDPTSSLRQPFSIAASANPSCCIGSEPLINRPRLTTSSSSSPLNVSTALASRTGVNPCALSSTSTTGGDTRLLFLGLRAKQRLLSSGSRTRAKASLQPPEAEPAEKQESSSSGDLEEDGGAGGAKVEKRSSRSPPVRNELNEAVKKTAATFAPRASTASKNPAPPGSTLYKVFEAQAYVAMVLGGALSFNLLFPADHPDIWRLMGMWSVWMFTVPSLRARDCSKKEKEALNYLFLVIPLINITLPFFWKSFPAVWSADVLAFFVIYAWKLEWLSAANKVEDS